MRKKSKLEMGLKKGLKEALRREQLANTYRKAIQIIENGEEFACFAILKAENIDTHESSFACRLFNKVYDPENGHIAYFSIDDKKPKYNKRCRQIALELLACMIEDGSLPIGGV